MLHHDRAPPHSSREKRISDYEGRWRGLASHSQSPNLNPLDLFLWVCMKLRVYHGGKPNRSNHLLETINESAVGNRNRLGCMLSQQSMAQCVAVCTQSNGGHFKHTLH